MTTGVPRDGRTCVALLSSLRTEYCIRSEQEKTVASSSLGYASCYALACLALQCASASNLDTNVLGLSEACEHMVLPGKYGRQALT